MRFKLILLYLFIAFGMKGQNILENGSLENRGSCPISSPYFSSYAAPWNYIGDTSNYYHPCGFPGNDSATNNALAFDGSGFAGINVYGEVTPGSEEYKRDYLTSVFSTPLDSGKFYRISFYVKPVNTPEAGYGYGVSNIGAVITDTLIDTGDVSISNIIDLNPQIIEPNVITQELYWTPICGIYKAHGGEQYITIGNFGYDIETTVLPLENVANPQYAYVLVDFVEVIENDLPELPLDTIICWEDRIDITIDEPGIFVVWDDESTGTTYTITEPGLYTAEISNGTCTYLDTILVDEVYCEFCDVYAPTAFTPDGDGRNDFFTVLPSCATEGELLSFEMRIFDRWGRKVFQSDSYEVVWDGKNADYQGIYTYVLEYRYSNEIETKTVTKRGFVSVLE